VNPYLLLTLDILAIGITLLAAYLWWRASGRKLRRIAKREDFDHQDLNRIIVAVNRSQVLNAKAAIASALSAMIIAMRFAAGMLQ
jgi:hypothetical protein